MSVDAFFLIMDIWVPKVDSPNLLVSKVTSGNKLTNA